MVEKGISSIWEMGLSFGSVTNHVALHMSLPWLLFSHLLLLLLEFKNQMHRIVPGTLWVFSAWKLNVDLHLTEKGQRGGFKSRPWSSFEDLSLFLVSQFWKQRHIRYPSCSQFVSSSPINV